MLVSSYGEIASSTIVELLHCFHMVLFMCFVPQSIAKTDSFYKFRTEIATSQDHRKQGYFSKAVVLKLLLPTPTFQNVSRKWNLLFSAFIIIPGVSVETLCMGLTLVLHLICVSSIGFLFACCVDFDFIIPIPFISVDEKGILCKMSQIRFTNLSRHKRPSPEYHSSLGIILQGRCSVI